MRLRSKASSVTVAVYCPPEGRAVALEYLPRDVCLGLGAAAAGGVVSSARAAAVKAAYQAYDAGVADLDRHADILHPNVEWQTNWPGLAPAVHGIDGVRRYLEAFLDPWEWVHSELRELVEVDEDTMFLWNHVRARGRESGVEIEMEIFDVLTFREGQIVLRRTWPERAPAAAAAGLPE